MTMCGHSPSVTGAKRKSRKALEKATSFTAFSMTCKEKSVRNSNYGAVVNWQFNYLKLGYTFVYQNFELPFIRSNQLYNKYNFSGTENYTVGLDYLHSKGKYQLFGEAAISKSKGKAFLQGVVAHLHDRLNFSLLFRHFDKDYHALILAPVFYPSDL